MQRFLDQLKHSMRHDSKLEEIAVFCMCDFIKASILTSKSQIAGYRFLVVQYEAEVREYLFSSSSFSSTSSSVYSTSSSSLSNTISSSLSNSNSSSSSKLVTEQLVINTCISFFYLAHRKTISTTFMELIRSNNSIHKRILVSALLSIASDKRDLPWTSKIQDTFDGLSTHIRQLFQDLILSVREYDYLKSSTDKRGKLLFEKVNIDLDILIKLIHLFKLVPQFVLHKPTIPNVPNIDNDEIRRVFTGLCDCIGQFSIPPLHIIASKTLIKLFQLEYMQNWGFLFFPIQFFFHNFIYFYLLLNNFF